MKVACVVSQNFVGCAHILREPILPDSGGEACVGFLGPKEGPLGGLSWGRQVGVGWSRLALVFNATWPKS